MRRAALILALLSALLLAVLVRAQFAPDPAKPPEVAQPPPASGMALLNTSPCRPGEIRRISVRGVEDHFSPAGDEPAPLPGRMKGRSRQITDNGAWQFDSPVADKGVATAIPLSPSTVSALLVIRLRPLGDTLNDTMALGDMTDGSPAYLVVRPAALDKQAGWRRHGDLYWTELSTLPTPAGTSVLDAALAGTAGPILDVLVVDDTAIDFVGLAACEAPARTRGVTLSAISIPDGKVHDVVGFECRPDDLTQSSCKPFVGDHSCEASFPLLCIRDQDLPVPPDAATYSDLASRRWSGGEVAATAPVKGSSFRTIGDADRACATRFGPDWRTAEWHDGGNGFGFSAKRGGRSFSGRYWIDIRGAPYGTCWSRNDEP